MRKLLCLVDRWQKLWNELFNRRSLSIGLSKFLNKQPGCNAIHVNQILQKWNTSDPDICNYADENNFIVITKDYDFKNSHFINTNPKKVIRITLGNISNADLLTIFEKNLPVIKELSGQCSFYVEINSTNITLLNRSIVRPPVLQPIKS